MDARLLRIRELITEQERIETELQALMGGGGVKERKPQTCSKCGEPGHSVRTCPKNTEVQ
jgi:Zinc knuckle